jgi:hypothetical protein
MKFSKSLNPVALFGVIFFSTMLLAQKPVGPLVSPAVRHDLSPALSSMAPQGIHLAPQGADSFWAEGAGQGLAPVSATLGLNFDGVGASANWSTPDVSAAVGASQYVQSVNTRYAVYNKTNGALVYGPVAENTLFSGFGGACQTANEGDPSTQYDKLANRWVISHHAYGAPYYYECVAVSKTSDATGAYYRYAFRLPAPYFPDYPMVGVWPDGYYISFNLQNQSSGFKPLGAMLCSVDRNHMLQGGAAQMVCFYVSGSGQDLTILPSDLDGTNPPPAGSPNYFVGLGSNSLNLYGFHSDFTTPKNSWFAGPTKLTTTAFTQACNGGRCIPQSDTTNVVDGIGDRLMVRVAYRNPNTKNYDVILVNHSITVSGHSGIRWYEIHNPGGSPTLYQSGTFSPDSNYRWDGSIAMDKVGDIALGYSVSSTSMHPAIKFTGRIPTDTLGAMETEATIQTGSGSQQSPNPWWNDVSSLSVDPVDDCTFWYSNEYYKADGAYTWSTRIASFKFTGCK